MENGNLWHIAMNDKTSMFLLLGLQNKFHRSFRAQQETQLEKEKRKGTATAILVLLFLLATKIVII